MKHYINKDIVKAELERRNKEAYGNEWGWAVKCSTYDEIISLINTLEVKEVDLELNSFDATVCKNGNTYLKEMDRNAIIKALEPYEDGDKVKVIIKAQK